VKWLKKLGDKLGQFSEYLQTFGPAGLFAVALLDSALIPMAGGPDAVMMALSVHQPGMMPVYAVSATLGSTIGCVILYYISKRAGRRALEKFSESKQKKVKGWIDKYDVLSVLVASVLPPPFPFKLFVITAGVFRLSLLRFTLAVAGGRAFRYFLEGFFAVRYGEQAMELFRKHYPAVGLALAVLIIGFFLLRALLKRRKAGGATEAAESQ
jgi:membrane protein YqaA with SNARE-associated domain